VFEGCEGCERERGGRGGEGGPTILLMHEELNAGACIKIVSGSRKHHSTGLGAWKDCDC
jgi:hypothetical protein